MTLLGQNELTYLRHWKRNKHNDHRKLEENEVWNNTPAYSTQVNGFSAIFRYCPNINTLDYKEVPKENS